MKKPTMNDATEQARSTRSDARAFAEAFAAADDAFTFGANAGESRTLTLDELGDVIVLDRPISLPAPQAPASRPVAPIAVEYDELITLDELSEALAGPVREADALDFDFGTSAHERARRRTAARFDASPSARRRISGPTTAARSRGGEVHPAAATPVAARLDSEVTPLPIVGDTSPGARATMAAAAASAAERLADPAGTRRFAPDRASSSRLDAVRALPASLRPSDDFLAGSGARRTVEITGRPGATAAVPRLRELERREREPRAVVDRLGTNPDRIAMWAVLLGILLVLIAFTSGSAGAVALPLLWLL